MDSITAKPKTITLAIETTLSPAGMRAHAQMLLDVARTLGSVSHAITLRETARAWREAARAAKLAEVDWTQAGADRQEALGGRLQVQAIGGQWRAYDRSVMVYDGPSESKAKATAMEHASA